MANRFYNPRPAISFLTLRTNEAGHATRTPNNLGGLNQPNALPAELGYAPEIPQEVLDSMIGDRMASGGSSNAPTTGGRMGGETSFLQSTSFV